MAFLRKIILFLILIGSFGFAYFYHPEPCAKPVVYSIGSFDTRFGISESDFRLTLKKAEDAWEKPVGRNLFEYNPDGRLKVNLIFDDRQATTDQNKVLEDTINKNKESADTLKTQLDNLEAEYTKDNNTYTNLLNTFGSEQAKYNAEVDFFNAKGGAPKADFDRLVLEKQSLAIQNKNLESKRVALNNLGDQINALIKKHNDYVDAANSKISTINKSAGKEFNEGEYVTDSEGERINIYEFTSKVKLQRILEHELGHALGMDHVDDEDSIMYYLNQGENLVPTQADILELEKVCATKPSYLQQAFDMIK